MLRWILIGVALLGAAAPAEAETPRMLVNPDGALTGPSGKSRTAIAGGFLAEHGFGASDLGSPQVQQTPGGVTIVSYRPSLRGIPTFEGARVALDRSGEVVESLGSPPAQVASVTPKLSVEQAVAAARRRLAGRASGVVSAPALTFYDGRLGWDFVYGDHHVVVDAGEGGLLYDASLVKTANDALVYPRAPGRSPAQDVTFPDVWLGPDAFTLDGPHVHAYADVNGDRVANPGEDIGRTAAGDFKYPLRDFSAPVEGRVGPTGCGQVQCTWDSSVPGSWRANREADTVQSFYLANTFHDHLAEPDTIAFLPPFAFEQSTGDALQLSADEGAAGPNDAPDFLHANNSSMDTLPQGQAAHMNMFLFKYSPFVPHAEGNGGDDALVLWHEYTHGLTGRLITTADGVEALDDGQASSMSEGWSDWYALDFAVDQGLVIDDPDVIGDVDEGADVDSTSDVDPGGHLVRTQGIDCPVGAGSPTVTTRCPGGFATGAGGYTYGDFAKIGQFGAEPHLEGEIWGETLWDLRRALIERVGSEAAGSRLAEQLVTEGLRLTPPEPTFLEARDAILAADRALELGLQDTLWQVFARRGMGFYAATASVLDVEPLEDFNGPPPADAPNGTLAGTVIDSQTGAGIANVAVALGPLNTTTDASGHYSLSVPQGRYPRLRYSLAGYDQNTSTPFTVAPEVTAVRDVKLVRDWAAASGGAKISDQSIGADDEDGNTNTCGPLSMISQDPRHAWVMLSPHAKPPFDPAAHQPFAVVELPQAVDIDQIGIDPSPRCLGDHPDQSAALGTYQLEVSEDGQTFRPFAGDGHGTFGPGDVKRLNLISPDGDNGRNVRFVRITPLAGLDERCDFPCEGSFEINVGQLEVFGAPTRSNAAPAATAEPAAAPPAPAAVPAPRPAPVRPSAKIPARGKGSRIAIGVTCASTCTVSAKLVSSPATAKRDRLRLRTLGTAKATVQANRTVTLKLTASVVRALKRLHRTSISGTLTVTIAGGQTTERRVKITR